MIVRPYRPEDWEEAAFILSACGYPLPTQEELRGNEEFVVQLGERVIAYGYCAPGMYGVGSGFLQCFAVDPQYHRTGTYVRAHRAAEQFWASKGVVKFVAYVPPGHEQFRAYLTERCGYRPYHHEADGTVFLVKEL